MRNRSLQSHPVLDYLIDTFNLKNDAALCRALGVDAPYISKVRNRIIPGSPTLAVAIHEVFEISFEDLRKLGGEDFVGVPAPTGGEL